MQKSPREILWSELCKRSDEITVQQFSSCLHFSQKMPIWRKVQICDESISKLLYCKKTFWSRMEIYVSQNRHKQPRSQKSQFKPCNRSVRTRLLCLLAAQVHTPLQLSSLHGLRNTDFIIIKSSKKWVGECHFRLASLIRASFPHAPLISLPSSRLVHISVSFGSFPCQNTTKLQNTMEKLKSLSTIRESKQSLLPFKSRKDVSCFPKA